MVLGAGSPIGATAFLRGCPDMATVTARTAAGTLVIDDPTLARIEHEQPALAAQFCVTSRRSQRKARAAM